MKIKDSLTRRTLLKGVSSAFLYAPLMRVFRESEALAASEPRVLFVYFGAGSYRDSFFPTGNTCDALPVVTAPMAAHKDDMVIFQGLSTRGASNHGGGPKLVFSGYTIGVDGIVPNIYSLDQQLADTMGANSLKKSVSVGCLSTLDGGGAEAISYNKAGGALPAVDDPKASYQDVFGSMFAIDGISGSSSLALAEQNVKSGKKRVLDYVKNDMKRIEKSLGPIEGKVFSAHVSALDELYADIKRQEDLANMMGNGGGNPNPGSMAMCDKGKLGQILPQGGGSSGTKWYHQLEMTPSVNKFNRELLLQAFACNITRVGLMQYGFSDVYKEFYFEGGAPTGIAYHSNSHANSPGLHNIQAAMIKEIATMISFFKANGLWDNTLVVFSTDLGDNPNNHDGVNIPCFMAGKMNGKLKGNRVLRYDNVEHNRFLVTAAHLLGKTDINHVGNTKFTGPLPNVF